MMKFPLLVLLFIGTLPASGFLFPPQLVQAEKEPAPYKTLDQAYPSPGTVYTHINRRNPSNKGEYFLDLGSFQTKEKAAAKQNELAAKSCSTRLFPLRNTAGTDIREPSLGYRVQAGSFTSLSEARKSQKIWESKGCIGTISYSGYDPLDTGGPLSIHILEVNPSAVSRLTAVLARDRVFGLETVSSIAKRKKAAAAINGGYFVRHKDDGTRGDLTGISIIHGEMVSEALNGRSALVLSKNSAEIGRISSLAVIHSSDGARRTISGFNRVPGLLRFCGNPGSARHGYTCLSYNELIRFSGRYGSRLTPIGPGRESAAHSNGTVIQVQEGRGRLPLPVNGAVYSGTGTEARWLKEHAGIGNKLTIQTSIILNRHSVQLTPDISAINGGPLLVQKGQISIDAAKEGFSPDLPFFYEFGVKRQPRTLAGIRPDGTVLLVAVDGRNPNESIGLNLYESAKLMLQLGAHDAINLDGGGSTTFVLHGRTVNHPSDPEGERPVGDALLLMP